MVNATIIEPWVQNISYLMNVIQLLVGGLFGLYLVEFIYRIFIFRKLRKQVGRILSEIDEVKKRLDRIERKRA